MAGNLVKRVMLKIVADDGDTEVKLDRISEKADELGRKHPELKVRVDAAAASAKLAVLRAELKKSSDSAGGGQGGLAFAVNRAVQSMGQFAGMGTTLINPITIAIGGLVAIMSGPLIASLLPITLGFAAFGAGAVGEIKKVITAHQQLTAAQQAYQKATTKAGRQSALAAEQRATEHLTGSEKGLLGMLGQLSHEFHRVEVAVRPEVVKAFGSALRILKDLFPAIRPLAVAAGKAVDGFLSHIDHWLRSSSGKKFLHWMETDGPKAIRTFGRVMWNVTQGVGRTFAFLDHAGNTWWHNVRRVWHDAAHQVGNFRIFFVRAGHMIESAWDHTISWITGHGARVINWFRALPGRVTGALRALPGQLLQLGKDAILGLVHGIESMAGAVAGAIGHIASSIPGKIASFLGIGSPSRVMRQHGQWIIDGLVMGINDRVGAVEGAMGKVAGVAGPRGGAGVGPLVVQLELKGSDSKFLSALAEQIRVGGGDPRILKRKVVLA